MMSKSSEKSIAVAVLLTLSGGFLDAFTYVGHGHVFANTMTGNIVLLGVSIAAGDWPQAARNFPPLAGFMAAVCVARLLVLTNARRWLQQPAIAALSLEIAFLAFAASGVADIPDIWLIPGISFVATLQTMFFTHLASLSYNSVMTTGNLRKFGQNLLQAFVPRYDSVALRDAGLLGTICLSFLGGAIIGGFSTSRFHDHALWIAVILLVGVIFCLMVNRVR